MNTKNTTPILLMLLTANAFVQATSCEDNQTSPIPIPLSSILSRSSRETLESMKQKLMQEREEVEKKHDEEPIIAGISRNTLRTIAAGMTGATVLAGMLVILPFADDPLLATIIAITLAGWSSVFPYEGLKSSPAETIKINDDLRAIYQELHKRDDFIRNQAEHKQEQQNRILDQLYLKEHARQQV